MPTRHPDQEPIIRVRPLSRQESTQLGEATPPGSRAYLVETSDRYVDFLATLLDILPELAAQQLRTGLEEKFAALVEHLVRDMVPLPSDDAHQAIQIARLRQQIAAEFPLWTSKDLAENAGSRSANPSSLTHNWRKAGRIFGVRVQQHERYPAFQFDAVGQPLPVIAEILSVLQGPSGTAGDGWRIATWFVSRNPWLPDNARPVDLLLTHPKLALEAARREREHSV